MTSPTRTTASQWIGFLLFLGALLLVVGAAAALASGLVAHGCACPTAPITTTI